MLLLWELYVSFFMVGVVCVGGGYASVPLIQKQAIDIHGWLTVQEFVDIFAISQMTPGPIGINAATFVGQRVAGFPGSIAATAGFVSPSVIILCLLTWLLQKYGELGAVKGILNGLRPAVVALIGGAALVFTVMSLFGAVNFKINIADLRYLNVIVMAVAYVLVKKKICGVIQVLLLSGVLGLILNSVAKMMA